MIDKKYNSKRLLIFSHVVLPRTLSTRKDREIRTRIDHRIDLWERRIHTGLMGGEFTEGRYREGRVEQSDVEEQDRLARSFHSTWMPGKLWQAVCWDNNREGGGVSPPGGCLHEDRATSCIRPPSEAPRYACTFRGKFHVRGLRLVQGGS